MKILLITYGGNGYGGITVGDFMFPGNTDQLDGNQLVPQAPWDETSSETLPMIGERCNTSPFSQSFQRMPDFAYVCSTWLGNLSSICCDAKYCRQLYSFYA